MEYIDVPEKIKVAICVGNASTLTLTGSLVANVFKNYGKKCETELFGSYGSLIEAIGEKHYSLILLDTDMPEADAMDVCVRIRRRDGTLGVVTGLVLVSDRRDSIFRYLKIQPMGFVDKNDFGRDCEKAVEDYLTLRELERNKYLVIDLGPRTVRVNTNDVVYVECIRDYQYFHTIDGETARVHDRMKDIENVLAPRGFIRVHKGYLVNFRYVESIDGAAVRLTRGGGAA